MTLKKTKHFLRKTKCILSMNKSNKKAAKRKTSTCLKYASLDDIIDGETSSEQGKESDINSEENVQINSLLRKRHSVEDIGKAYELSAGELVSLTGNELKLVPSEITIRSRYNCALTRLGWKTGKNTVR